MLFLPATKVFPLQVCIIYAAYQYVASQSSNFVNILLHSSDHWVGMWIE